MGEGGARHRREAARPEEGASPLWEPGARLEAMNDDRDTRGQELSTSEGRTRPGQVDGQQLGGVPGDGAAAGAETAGFPTQSQAPWQGGSGGVSGDGMAGAGGVSGGTIGGGTAGGGIAGGGVADGGGGADSGADGAGLVPGPAPRG